MGLFSKIRDILTYEDETEEEIKKEVTTVEIPSPEEEQSFKRNYDFDITEKEFEEEPVKKQVKEKPAFTIFTDSDFDTIEKVEKKKDERKPYTPKVETKKFKPSPIISPVYGVIKEEKAETISFSPYTKHEEITIDDVRKKAFGTASLEDDLETNLFSTKELTLESTSKNDIFDEVDSALDERDSKEKIDFDSDNAINENDLFNLIDSMYERNDE